MVFQILKEFCDRYPHADISDILVNIQKNHHYILADVDTRSVLGDIIKTHGSTNDKKHWEAFKERSGFNPDKLLKAHLRNYVIDDGFNFELLRLLTSEPGHVFLENGNYEWPTYKIITETYKNDPRFKYIFRYLHDRMIKKHIVAEHCGGRDEIIPKILSIEAYDPRKSWLMKNKYMVVFDRDTEDDLHFCNKNDRLFDFCCGKNHTTVKDSDIYTLDQTNLTWHSWYRRAVENYFDRKCYEECNVNMLNVPSDPNKYYYFKIEDSKIEDGNGGKIRVCFGYKKSNLHTIASKTDRDRMENDLKNFSSIQGDLSEIQLFLLKLVKLV